MKISTQIYTFSSRPKILTSRRHNLLLSLDHSQSASSVDGILVEESRHLLKHQQRVGHYDKRYYFKKKAEEVSVLASGVRGFKIAVKSR